MMCGLLNEVLCEIGHENPSIEGTYIDDVDYLEKCTKILDAMPMHEVVDRIGWVLNDFYKEEVDKK